ncbi:hypothetical protein CRG98_010050 [Punica granatum]|uniref:Uncharacterized protein n=1 Tax=Punica granatum TaxID=22663 RepID=A0A2I0KM44_PUNGR|nr:hypothetical protein CRG98_010050 [Punica granatum]
MHMHRNQIVRSTKRKGEDPLIFNGSRVRTWDGEVQHPHSRVGSSPEQSLHDDFARGEAECRGSIAQKRCTKRSGVLEQALGVQAEETGEQRSLTLRWTRRWKRLGSNRANLFSLWPCGSHQKFMLVTARDCTTRKTTGEGELQWGVATREQMDDSGRRDTGHIRFFDTERPIHRARSQGELRFDSSVGNQKEMGSGLDQTEFNNEPRKDFSDEQDAVDVGEPEAPHIEMENSERVLRKYVLEILKECGMLGARPSTFPMEQHHRLTADLGTPVDDPNSWKLTDGHDSEPLTVVTRILITLEPPLPPLPLQLPPFLGGATANAIASSPALPPPPLPPSTATTLTYGP